MSEPLIRARLGITMLSVLFIFSLLLGGCRNLAGAPGAGGLPVALWAMEGGAPDRGRFSLESIAPPLAVEQIYTVDGDTQFASPITVAQARVLIEGERKLYALELDSGYEAWHINLAGAFLSPAVAGDHVFVRVESGDDGYLVALRFDDGAKLWEFKFPSVGSAYDNLGGHVTSPLIVDGTVLVGAAHTLFALDATDGDLLWQAELAAPVASSVASSADGSGDMVFVTDFTQLYAIDLASGEEAWRFEHDTLTLQFAPIILGERILITSHNSVVLLDHSSGDLLWRREFGDVALVPAAAAPDRIYVKSANQLLALAADDGATLWEYAAENFVSLPALTADFVYLITRAEGSSQLRALAVADGQEVWRSDAAQFSNAAPVIAGGRVYVRSVDGQILAYQPQKE